MPSLKGYSSDLEYSYTPGVFPSLELMRVRPQPSRGAGPLAGDAVSPVAWGHPAHSSQAESVVLRPK